MSIYLKTKPLFQDTEAYQIERGNLAKKAHEQLESTGLDKRQLAELMEHFGDLDEDDESRRLPIASAGEGSLPIFPAHPR